MSDIKAKLKVAIDVQQAEVARLQLSADVALPEAKAKLQGLKDLKASLGSLLKEADPDSLRLLVKIARAVVR